MRTVEQLKELVKELNNSGIGEGLLKFKVMNKKYGTGISWIGTWGRYGGPDLKAGNKVGSLRGKYQGFGRTDEEFVEELKRDVKAIIENLVKDYNSNKFLHHGKFEEAMEQYFNK